MLQVHLELWLAVGVTSCVLMPPWKLMGSWLGFSRGVWICSEILRFRVCDC